MPVPADVIWRSPRFSTSRLPIESWLRAHQHTRWRLGREGGHSLLELAGDDVGEDLELAVRVRAEARLRLDAVLVQHAQASELVVSCIAVPARDVSVDVTGI